MESKKVTIQDIAEFANVSKSTVSRVLNNTTPVNDEKRQAVLQAVKELEFEPNSLASGLAGGQSMTIGIQTQKIGSPFYDLLTSGILGSLTDTRYSSILVDGFWDKTIERRGIETLLRRQVDGLIIVGGDLEYDDLMEISNRRPTLVIGREVAGMESRCLFVDNFDVGYRATKFLIDLGHREIVHITGIRTHQDAIRRYRGYRHALEEAGIPFDQDLVFQGSFDGPTGSDAIKAIVAKNKAFTAVFAGNDMSAYGARLALYELGMDVPGDVSIIGVDDQVESAYMIPPLTSIRQPAFEMGQTIGKAMVDLLANRDHVMTRPSVEICVRESTAPRQ